jgi:transcriptional regulator of arginine metabolism
MKARRQSQILDLIDHEPVASQEALLLKLQDRGIRATQATISRDLKQLGLVKRAGDGAYARPGAERTTGAADHLKRSLASLMRSLERVDTLVVVKTDRGQAQGLAEWIDRAQLAEIAGTLGGDDTILLVCRGTSAAESIERLFNSFASGGTTAAGRARKNVS